MADIEYLPQIPSLNPTRNQFKHEICKFCVLHFSGAVVTSDVYLMGPGLYVGDGFPIPFSGEICALSVYDGNSVRANVLTPPVSFNADDRISVKATWDQPWMQVEVHINGVNAPFNVNQVMSNSSLAAAVTISVNL